MMPPFSDTTCNKDGGTTSWEAMYNLLEEEKPMPWEIKAKTDAEVQSDASYLEAACSFLQIIPARPKKLPYTNMVKWVVDNVNISDRTFRNARHEVMGSFTLDNLHQMYQLPEPQKLYDKDFLQHFTKKKEDHWMLNGHRDWAEANLNGKILVST